MRNETIFSQSPIVNSVTECGARASGNAWQAVPGPQTLSPRTAPMADHPQPGQAAGTSRNTQQKQCFKKTGRHPPKAAAIGSGQSRDGRQQCAGHRSPPCRPGPLPAPDSSLTDCAHGRNPSMAASRMAFERITIRRGFLQSPAFHQDRKIPHPHCNSALCLSGDAGLPACDARNAGHRSARRPFQTIPLARRNLAKGMMPITRECAVDPPLPKPFPASGRS